MSVEHPYDYDESLKQIKKRDPIGWLAIVIADYFLWLPFTIVIGLFIYLLLK